MLLTIFGATGNVGKQLVKHALHQGHIVKAFGRNVFTAKFEEDKNLHLVQGALFDEDQVYKAIKGSNAVLSALGGAFDGTDKSRSLGVKNIISQMEKAGVKRIIAVGGKGILEGGEGEMIMEDPSFPKQFMPVSIEHFKAYEFLKASNLDWTFIGAPDLVESDATGIYKTASDSMPTNTKHKINTGDLAQFIINELKNNAFVRMRAGISN